MILTIEEVKAALRVEMPEITEEQMARLEKRLLDTVAALSEPKQPQGETFFRRLDRLTGTPRRLRQE